MASFFMFLAASMVLISVSMSAVVPDSNKAEKEEAKAAAAAYIQSLFGSNGKKY